jgi:pimeloyl-ACP methyl ester carboxylesterase
VNAAEFHSQRRHAATASGHIAYVEQGRGPVALFLHGVPLNGYHWRHVVAGLKDIRRCIALDLMGLGYTEIGPAHDVSFTAQATMVAQFLDALGIGQADLVASDSGGAIAQLFAARHPHRLRTLTLTNCDVHDNWPPEAIAPQIEAARQGILADAFAAFRDDAAARRMRFARAYADPGVLTDEVFRTYVDPLVSDAQRRDNFHRYWLAFDPRQTVEIEPLLRALPVPTLIVWGLADIFFGVEWAHWLRRTLPRARDVVEVPGAKLFFPEDRPQALIEPLRSFLTSSP